MANSDAQLALNDIFSQIKLFMDQKQWADAHRACLEILRYDQENLKAIHLKNKIEKIVKNNNRKIIKDDLEQMAPLWHEKNYVALLDELKKLQPYSQDYPQIQKMIIKAEKEYRKQIANQEQTTFVSEYKQIQQFIKEKKYQEALRAAEKLRILKVQEDNVRNLIKNIKAEWIESELESSSTLIQSEKYEDMLLLYQKLLKIDSGSLRVKNLIESTKKTYQRYRIDEKREFIYKALEHTKTLYQLKKYERALDACLEILGIDPDNKDAQKFYKKSLFMTRRLIDKELFDQMKEAQKNIRVGYKTNKDDYIKI